MATNLLEVMQGYADGDDDHAGVHFWNTSSRDYDLVPYGELSRRAFAFGARLLESERGAGAVCMIACHSPYATLIAFYGAISVGAVPMIFPMPRALGSHDALIERIQHWGSRLRQPSILVLEEGLDEKFHQAIPATQAIIRLGASPLGQWDQAERPAREHSLESDDVAFFQTTSSSTGDHKAVAISHANILSNVDGIRAAVLMDTNERMIAWLPLFHDMGLVGSVLFTFCNAYSLYLMTPTQFIKRPVLWLNGMSEHRCTITTAPNFGYDYCSRLVADHDAAKLDLSCVKHFFIGAEPIRVSTIKSFCDKFRVSGVVPGMIRPAYGLAESTIITTISQPKHKAGFIYLDADSIGMGRPVRVMGSRDFAALDDVLLRDQVAVCTAGTPIDRMQVSLVDEEGHQVGEHHAGEIVIQGSSVALGYVDGEQEMVQRFEHQQIGTGDMGVIVDGDLFIIERIKNVIIRNGENYLVSAMEQRLAELLQISHENVAVFESDIHDPASPIVVLVEKHGGLEDDQIEPMLAALPQDNFPLDLILFHRSRTIPRTTSGKKRHFFCRKQYQKGELDYQQRIEVTADRIAAAKNKNSGETQHTGV